MLKGATSYGFFTGSSMPESMPEVAMHVINVNGTNILGSKGQISRS